MSKAEAKPKAKGLIDALSKNDPDTIRRNAIEDRFRAMLAIGPQEWDYEADFAKHDPDRLSQPVLQKYRSAYRKHVAIAPRMGDKASKVLWFADQSVAEEFRKKSGAKMPESEQS